MKKNMIVGIAIAMGMLSVGAIQASAAGSCCSDGKCTCSDKQIMQQFSQEAAGLTSALAAKGLELRELYSYEGIDIRKADRLEEEIKELKGKIKVIGKKYDIKPCCLG